MTRPPDLRDLIGDEGPDERLARAHDLLVAAGAPPEGVVPQPPQVARRPVRLRRRRWLELTAAAALVCVALAVGFLVGTRGGGFESVATLSMHGVAPLANASAELEIGETDEYGNVPMEMHVQGLPALPQGGWYELFLTKKNVIGASCGTFRAVSSETTVRLNVGYDLGALRKAGVFDGWAVTAHVPGKPGSAARILLTT
jgi:hypothetical protein